MNFLYYFIFLKYYVAKHLTVQNQLAILQNGIPYYSKMTFAKVKCKPNRPERIYGVALYLNGWENTLITALSKKEKKTTTFVK